MQALEELPGAQYYPNWLNDKEIKMIIAEADQLRYNSSLRGITGSSGPNLFCHLGSSNRKPPSLVNMLVDKLNQYKMLQGTFRQITINKYSDLTKYIIPHKDGFGVQAAIITLGPCHSVLNFYDHPEDVQFLNGTKVYLDEEKNSVASVYMEPGSCLILRDESFIRLSHGITPHKRDMILGPSSKTVESTEDMGTQKLCNSHLITPKEGDVVERGERYSIVIWTK